MAEVNIYEPRMLVGALRNALPAPTFLLDTFFKTVLTFDKEFVDIDVKKDGGEMAVFVNPVENGHLVEDESFQTNSVKPAYTREKKIIRPNNVIKRMFGEDYSAPLTPEERAQRQLGENLTTLDTRIRRLEEWMAAQSLVTGKVEVLRKGGTISHVVDFGYELGEHIRILTGSSAWSNSGSTPLEDLDEAQEDTGERGGITPTIAIAGKKAINALINNPSVKERFNILNYNYGTISPATYQNPLWGVKYYGRIMPSDLELYSYTRKVRHPISGKLVPLIPDDVIVIGNPDAGCQLLYGLIQNMHSLSSLPRFPLSWVEDDGSGRFVQLESAPLTNLYNPDAFTVLRVLGK